MSIRFDKLRFSVSRFSQSTIAGLLGVSQPTVSRWSRGLTSIPSAFAGGINKIFRNAAYQTLRSVGANTSISRKYSSYGFNSVMLKISEIGLMAEDFTTGAFADYLIKTGRTLSESEIGAQWGKIHHDVVTAMGSSKLPDNIWEEYFNRAL